MYKGNRLSDWKWEGGSNLEELVTWGVLPAMSFVDVLDDIADNRDFSDNSTACYIVNELKCKLEDIKETIYRFIDEKYHEEKQKKDSDESKTKEDKKKS